MQSFDYQKIANTCYHPSICSLQRHPYMSSPLVSSCYAAPRNSSVAPLFPFVISLLLTGRSFESIGLCGARQGGKRQPWIPFVLVPARLLQI